MMEFAAGDAVRALADKGYTVSEIHDKLSYPVSRQAIGELVWGHYLDNGTICLTDPTNRPERFKTSYKKVQNEYGKVSFQQVRESVSITGEYLQCDFGKRLYQDREGFMQELQRLDKRDQDYVLGLPWPLTPVYHKKDERMTRIHERLF
ncbi:MAG: hypothetical protein J6Z22_09195 [Lachnospiraceae bacterium]|nr:hypothetical protein [Lachnospiraceae bacterium]